MNENMKRKISDVLDLPKDIVLDLTRLTITGNLTVMIENHKGIIEYNPDLIRVNSNNGVIIIKGEDLFLKSAIVDEVIIEGKIRSVEFD